MILRAGEGLGLGQRHEDRVFVEGGGVRGVDAADGEELLVHAPIGAVDQQVDLIADAHPELVGQRLADQYALAIVGREELARKRAPGGKDRWRPRPGSMPMTCTPRDSSPSVTMPLANSRGVAATTCGRV